MPRNPEMDERFTPAEVFGLLNRLFDFDMDPCTTAENPLGCRYFYTATEDGLAHTWAPWKVFVNPPYSAMQAWALKAVQEAQNGAFVAFILPNDATTTAYKLLEENAWGYWRPPFRAKFLTPFLPKGKHPVKDEKTGLWKVDVARSHVVFFLGGLP